MKVIPRNTIKRVINSHLSSNTKIHGDEAEVLIYLSLLAFLQDLADESRLQMQMEGTRGRQLLRRHVLTAGKTVLKKKFQQR